MVIMDGSLVQGLCRLGLEFFPMVLKTLTYTPNQIMFVLQTTENSEKRVVEIQQTKLNNTIQTNQNYTTLETLTGRK